MSPVFENNRELPLDKYVLLKGGETKTPVPGKYAENGSAKNPATKRRHCALKARPPLSPLSCLKALHSLSQPTFMAGSASWSTNAA